MRIDIPWFQYRFDTTLKGSRTLGTWCAGRVRGSFGYEHCECHSVVPLGECRPLGMQQMGKSIGAACHFVKSQHHRTLWITERLLQQGQASCSNSVCELLSYYNIQIKPPSPKSYACGSGEGTQTPLSLEAVSWAAMLTQSLEKLGFSKHDYTCSLNSRQSLEEQRNKDSVNNM